MTQTPRADVEKSLKLSRTLNYIFIPVTIFLAIVVAAQMIGKSDEGGFGGKGEGTRGDQVVAEEENPENDNPEVEETETSSEEGDFVRRDPDDPMAIGDVDAPIVMTEWLDMRCPYCALFAQDTLPTIIEEYVDTGKLRIEFIDVAYFGDESEGAAMAARAAGKQGKYVEFMQEVYDRDPGKGHQDLPKETLIEIAEAVGVKDMKKFEKDMVSDEIRTEVEMSTAEAQSLGVSAVPFFVVYDQAVSGAQEVDTFREFIDLQLDGAK